VIPRLVRVGDAGEPISGEGLGESVVIEIPTEITGNHESWREATRKAFTSAIDAGYVVEGFYVVQRGEREVGKYVLTQRRKGAK
jgi:predicted GNAT superfamily acetyltransferase